MSVYLLRRVLWMIPTFLGISLVLWLVMAFSPGKPTSGGGAGDMGSDPSVMDPNQNEGERMFREQFALNRPVLWNDWTSLRDERVLELVRIVQGGVAKHGVQDFREAREQLMDFGRYAVPPLMRLLESTTGDDQTAVVGWLRYCAQWPRAMLEAGKDPTPEELALERAHAEENRTLKSADMIWPSGATPAERAPVIARWKAWYASHASEWDLGTGERAWRTVADTQFGRYWGNLFTLELGQSSRERKPVKDMIVERMKYSLTLAVPSFVIAWILAVLLGVVSATRHGRAADHSIGLGLYLLYSIPSFAAATVLQRVFAQQMGWFPLSGFDDGTAAAQQMTTWEHLKNVLWHITLPIICYTYGSFAYISRQARSGMLEVLKSDYVRTARAKGLPERQVVWRHAVRNGMMPVVTLLGTALPVLLGGSVVIEYIFNINGFGLLLINSIHQKDYNVIMGIELLVAALTLVGLLLTDVLYAAMDPRISYS